MNPEQQRIAIAEACGRKVTGVCPSCAFDQNQFSGHASFCAEVPNYPNDLNAMHEAEKGLTTEQYRDYMRQLNEIIPPDIWTWWAGAIRATARQRAAAFIETLQLKPKP